MENRQKLLDVVNLKLTTMATLATKLSRHPYVEMKTSLFRIFLTYPFNLQSVKNGRFINPAFAAKEPYG
ncbi:MAG: hypothetical protein ACOYOS_17615 [Syntrophales bacterium]